MVEGPHQPAGGEVGASVRRSGLAYCHHQYQANGVSGGTLIYMTLE